jgi:hypothetical protein
MADQAFSCLGVVLRQGVVLVQHRRVVKVLVRPRTPKQIFHLLQGGTLCRLFVCLAKVATSNRRTDARTNRLLRRPERTGRQQHGPVVRETLEDAGIHCQITGIVGIYTDPNHIILYTSNGEAHQEFSILPTGRYIAGPTPSSESKEVHWVEPSQLTDLTRDPSMRRRINHYLDRPTTPLSSDRSCKALLLLSGAHAMPTHPKATDPGREAAPGRIPLWLDPEDLTWLGSHCACSEDTPVEERERCGRIHFVLTQHCRRLA